MVDKNTLQRMSQEVLVIPLSDEIAESLTEFCNTQIEGLTCDRLDEMIMHFITRKNDEDLLSELEKYIETKDFSSKASYTALLPILEEFIVLLTIERCEDDEKKALYSLLLKNALILAVKGNGFVASPQELLDIFNYYSVFLTENKVFKDEIDSSDVVRDLLDADEDSFNDKIGETDNSILRAIVYDTALFRYDSFVNTLQLDADNIFQSIYMLTNRLINGSTWRYIDHDVAKTLTKLLGEYRRTKITLKELKSNLKELISKEDKEYKTTSVLLRLLVDDGEEIEFSDNIIFSAEEFSVYLYYELLAESMACALDKINE